MTDLSFATMGFVLGRLECESVNSGNSMARPLTKRQREIYTSIRAFIDQEGYAPSVRQIGRIFDLRPATVQQHLDALEKKGYLSRTGTANGLILADSLTHQTEEKRRTAVVIGTIAAGEPILAFDDPSGFVYVPGNLPSGKYFALRVAGSSMIDDHILDGDLVIIRQQPTADDGDVVVAILEDETATLKRLYRDSEGFKLQPANSAMDPIWVKKLRVRGKVVAVYRVRI